MPLTNVQCRNARPSEAGSAKMADRDGLYLLVKPAGKYWRGDYRHDGRRKTLALGVYPTVTLAAARDAWHTARRQLADGTDPGRARKELKLARKVAADNSFESVARGWHAWWSPARTERHATYVLRRLEADIFPEIGALPVSEIRARHLVAVARKIESRGALDIAKRALETCGQILRYAVVNDMIDRNPAVDVKPSDALKPRKKRNYTRVSERELPDLLRGIDTYVGGEHTRLAMQLMALTFVRTGELIGARWDEFDRVKKQWRIPASRMKMDAEHIVPLSRQALVVLDRLEAIRYGRPILFPGERDHAKPMSNNTILYALYRLGYHGRMTGHGFRGVASTILHERGWPHDHIELQLAHGPRDAVSAAYNHALYLPQRAEMMQAWADLLDQLRAEAEPAAIERSVIDDRMAA